MFGLDSPLGLFPPGIDPGKLYNPLMEMSDPRGMPGETPPFLKKKSKYKFLAIVLRKTLLIIKDNGLNSVPKTLKP